MLVLILFLNLISLAPSNAAEVNPSFVMDKKFFSPVSSKKTVCTFTINSSEEKNEFLKGLGADNFNFVEMVPQDKVKSGEEANSEAWFEQSCQSNIKCDVIVISGHFVGTFFGSSGRRLSLETMQNQACSQTCKGVLNAPKEVFLFGCNTLATKDRDARTPDQYRQILVADGFTSDQADALAGSRYGMLGVDNLHSMTAVFSGVPKIYGFSSIAPSGPHVKDMLSNYFKSTGNYVEHLNSITTASSQKPNQTLANALKQTHFSEASGDDEKLSYSNFSCVLYDSKMPIEEKVKQAKIILNTKERFSYLPAIEKFIRENPNDLWTAQLKNEVNSRQDIKDIVVRVLNKTESLSIAFGFFKIAKTFGFVDSNYFDSLLKERFLRPVLRLPMSPERADIVSSLDFGEYGSVKVDDSDLITREHFRDPQFSSALNLYLGSRDRGITFKGSHVVDLGFEILEDWQHSSNIEITNAIWFLKYRNSACDYDKPYPKLNELLNSILAQTTEFRTALTVLEGKRYDTLPTPKALLERVVDILPSNPALLDLSDESLNNGTVWLFYAYAGTWRRELGMIPRLDSLRELYTTYYVSHPTLLRNDKTEYFNKILKIPFQMGVR